MPDQLNIQAVITELEARLKRLDTERAEILQKLRDLYTGSPQAEKFSSEAAHKGRAGGRSSLISLFMTPHS